MAIYVYRQCPPTTRYGNMEYSSCGGPKCTQQQAIDIAKWHRDMGPKITVSANYWAYNQTKRGVYYTQWDFNGPLTDNDVDVCNWGPRTFTGSGVKGTHNFTPCGCDPHGCLNGFSAECEAFSCYCEKFPTEDAEFTTGNWHYMVGNIEETYSSEICWEFPVFRMGTVCTADCLCNPLVCGNNCGGCDRGCGDGNYWSAYWFNCCDEQTTRGTWQYDSSGTGKFTFKASWYWYNDEYQSNCGNCCDKCMARCKDENGNPTENCCCCCGCCDPGPKKTDPCESSGQSGCKKYHDIWHKGEYSVTVTGGAKSSLKCEVR